MQQLALVISSGSESDDDGEPPSFAYTSQRPTPHGTPARIRKGGGSTPHGTPARVRKTSGDDATPHGTPARVRKASGDGSTPLGTPARLRPGGQGGGFHSIPEGGSFRGGGGGSFRGGGGGSFRGGGGGAQAVATPSRLRPRKSSGGVIETVGTAVLVAHRPLAAPFPSPLGITLPTNPWPHPSHHPLLQVGTAGGGSFKKGGSSQIGRLIGRRAAAPDDDDDSDDEGEGAKLSPEQLKWREEMLRDRKKALIDACTPRQYGDSRTLASAAARKQWRRTWSIAQQVRAEQLGNFWRPPRPHDEPPTTPDPYDLSFFTSTQPSPPRPRPKAEAAPAGNAVAGAPEPAAATEGGAGAGGGPRGEEEAPMARQATRALVLETETPAPAAGRTYAPHRKVTLSVTHGVTHAL